MRAPGAPVRVHRPGRGPARREIPPFPLRWDKPWLPSPLGCAWVGGGHRTGDLLLTKTRFFTAPTLHYVSQEDPSNHGPFWISLLILTLDSQLLSARFLRESRSSAGTTSPDSGAAVSSALSIWSR